MSEVGGTVVEIRGDEAIVACPAEFSGCAACSGGRGCSWRRIVGSRSLAVPLQCPGGQLQRGDAVTLIVDDASLLGAALRLYLPPLAGLLAAPALLRLLTADSGSASLLAAVAGLAAGLLVARRWTTRMPPLRVERTGGDQAPPPQP
jgi:sigma-E factor negative regulatory protein RseC